MAKFFLPCPRWEERARSIRPLSLLIKRNRNRKAESKLHNYTPACLSLGFVPYLVSDRVPFFFPRFPRHFFPPLSSSIRLSPSEQDYKLARNTSTSSVRAALKKLRMGSSTSQVDSKLFKATLSKAHTCFRFSNASSFFLDSFCYYYFAHDQWKKMTDNVSFNTENPQILNRWTNIPIFYINTTNT